MVAAIIVVEMILFLGLLVAVAALILFAGFCFDVGTRKGRWHSRKKY